jgi:hypothetical protein
LTATHAQISINSSGQKNITPSFDKQGFCRDFRTAAQSVWNHFLTDETDGFQHNQATFYQDCGFPKDSTPDANLTNACIIQHIVGYNSDVLGGELPGQVQALLRGVAYNTQDGQTAISIRSVSDF